MLKQKFRGAFRVASSAYVANGLVAGLSLLAISILVHFLLGPQAAAAATVGVIVVTPPDQPGPRRGKLAQMLPAVLVGAPLFLVTSLLRGETLALGIWLTVATFFTFLAAAWGKRGLLTAVSAMFAMLFALAPGPAGAAANAWQSTLAFGLGAWLHVLVATLANTLLNRRFRVLALVETLDAAIDLMRTQGLQFTMNAQLQDRTALAGRLMKQQAAFADRLQAARDMLLESPDTPHRQQLAAILLQLLDMRDHLLACALDLEELQQVPQLQELLQVLGIEIQALASDMVQLADALLAGRLPPPTLHRRPALAATAAMAPNAASTGPGAASSAPWSATLAGAMARRVGYLHDEVTGMVALTRGERSPDMEAVRSAWRLFVSATNWTSKPLQALWRTDAPPLRHAARAAVAVAAGFAAGAALPWGAHEYWILVTITVVLRGSLAQTLERLHSRLAGTLLGCLLAGTLLYAGLPAPLLVLILAVAQAIAHAFALQRYTITAVAASVLGLVQAHMLDGASSPVFNVAERVLDTVVGVGIAWLASYVLPTWERTQVAALVTRALAGQVRHASLALRAGPGGTLDSESDLAWRLARREAYDSLSAMVFAVQRSLAEPRAVRPPLQALERMLMHGYQLIAHLTAIKTTLQQRQDRLDLALLQQPLAEAALAIASDLTPGDARRDVAVGESGELTEALSKDAGRDLTPVVVRRLRLAVATGHALKRDAEAAALVQGELDNRGRTGG